MNPQSAGRAYVVVFSLVLLSALTGTGQASVRIGGASLSANGQIAQNFQYAGSCPVNLRFDWGVISTEPTSITYSFRRSDGGHSSTSTASLPGANRSMPIPDEWSLGANNSQFADYHGWVELDIESPNPVSQKIAFTIHCGQASVRIGGASLSANGQIAQNFQYAGSCPVNLKFDWGVISTEPTSITYSLRRSDGGHSRASTASLPGANRSMPILDEWSLGANNPQFADYHGWVELDIESPNPVSQKIGFTIHCG
ncbi:MAG: hypothetical protein WBQ08_17280 [Candidatus Sulfotelmatobacter sp.]